MVLFLILLTTCQRSVCCTFVDFAIIFGFDLSGSTEIGGLLDILSGCEDGNGEDIIEENLRFYFFVGLILLQVFFFAFLLIF